MATLEKSSEFADHVTNAAVSQSEAVPVVNHKCFCNVAAAMGFQDEALNIFDVQHTLGIYRNLVRRRKPFERKVVSSGQSVFSFRLV